MARLWGVLWHSQNRLDGESLHLMYEEGIPVLFRTRRQARKWIVENYGYIRERSDLRREPHGWRIPRPVRVRVVRCIRG